MAGRNTKTKELLYKKNLIDNNSPAGGETPGGRYDKL